MWLMQGRGGAVHIDRHRLVWTACVGFVAAWLFRDEPSSAGFAGRAAGLMLGAFVCWPLVAQRLPPGFTPRPTRGAVATGLLIGLGYGILFMLRGDATDVPTAVVEAIWATLALFAAAAVASILSSALRRKSGALPPGAR